MTAKSYVNTRARAQYTTLSGTLGDLPFFNPSFTVYLRVLYYSPFCSYKEVEGRSGEGFGGVYNLFISL